MEDHAHVREARPSGSLPPDVRTRAEQELGGFCVYQNRVRDCRDRRLGFTMDGATATVYELRPVPPTWTRGERFEGWSRRVALAQFRFDLGTRQWAAYWADRQQCWQRYDVQSTDDLAALLAALSEDLEVFSW